MLSKSRNHIYRRKEGDGGSKINESMEAQGETETFLQRDRQPRSPPAPGPLASGGANIISLPLCSFSQGTVGPSEARELPEGGWYLDLSWNACRNYFLLSILPLTISLLLGYTWLTLSSGCLPPRLLAETLHSIQAILFHFDDHRSSRILERLITKDGFDEHCAQAEGYKIFDGADNLDYRYWGERLAALHNFTRERPPRNKFERWMKWQSSERNAFAVALAALLISILVGLLSLAVAGLQTWIAWEAWKQPVSNDDETIEILREVANLLREQLRG